MNDINSLAYWKKVDELKVKMDKDPQLMQKCKDDPAAFIKEHGIDAEIRINEKGDKKLLSEYLVENKTDLLKDITIVGKAPGNNLIIVVVANVVAFANAVANANAAVNANAVANANAAVNTNTFGKPIYPESTTRTVSRTSVSGDSVKSRTQVGGIPIAPEITSKSQVTSEVKVHADIMSDVKTSVSGSGHKPIVSGTENINVAVDALVMAEAKSSVYVCTNSTVNSDGLGFAVVNANVGANANAIANANVYINVNAFGKPVNPEASIATKVRTSTDGDGDDGIIERPRPDLRVKTAVKGLDVKPIRPIRPIEPIKPVRPIRPGRPIATIQNEDAKNYLIGEYQVTYDMSDEVYEIFKREFDKQSLSKERQQAVIKRAVTNPDRVLDAKVYQRAGGTEKELKQAEFKREVRLGDKLVTEKLSKEIAEMIEAKKYSLDETVEYQYKDKRFRIHITISGKHVTIDNVEVTDNE